MPRDGSPAFFDHWLNHKHGCRPRQSRDRVIPADPLRRYAPPPPQAQGDRIWQFSVVSGGVTPALERSRPSGGSAQDDGINYIR